MPDPPTPAPDEPMVPRGVVAAALGAAWRGADEDEVLALVDEAVYPWPVEVAPPTSNQLRDAPACPRCGSTNIFATDFVAALSCRTCQFCWPEKRDAASAADPPPASNQLHDALKTIVRAVDANPNRLREIAQGGLDRAALAADPTPGIVIDRETARVCRDALRYQARQISPIAPHTSRALARLDAALANTPETTSDA